MKSLGLKISAISKLKIYSVARRIILHKMDIEAISSEKAAELINFFKSQLPSIETAEMAEDFLLKVVETFPELKELPIYFKNQEDEKFDELAMLISEELMEKNDFEKAQEIIEQLKSLAAGESKIAFMEKLERSFPMEFKKAVEQIIKNK